MSTHARQCQPQWAQCYPQLVQCEALDAVAKKPQGMPLVACLENRY